MVLYIYFSFQWFCIYTFHFMGKGGPQIPQFPSFSAMKIIFSRVLYFPALLYGFLTFFRLHLCVRVWVTWEEFMFCCKLLSRECFVPLI